TSIFTHSKEKKIPGRCSGADPETVPLQPPCSQRSDDLLLELAVRPDPTLQRGGEQWGSLLQRAPGLHTIYILFGESSLLKRICSSLPMASSKKNEVCLRGQIFTCCEVLPPENDSTEREKERDIRPGGDNGRPDIPKKAGFTEEMSQHIRASTKSISQKPDDLTTKTEKNVLMSEDEEECEGMGKNQGAVREGAPSRSHNPGEDPPPPQPCSAPCPGEVKPKPERRELSQLLNLSTHPQHYPLKINHAGEPPSQTRASYVSTHAPLSAGSSLETSPTLFHEADVRMAAIRPDASQGNVETITLTVKDKQERCSASSAELV
ncbi:Acryloyl-CoA reductase electron transfer subunit beta, partial [Dissostichus eleginoides]